MVVQNVPGSDGHDQSESNHGQRSPHHQAVCLLERFLGSNGRTCDRDDDVAHDETDEEKHDADDEHDIQSLSSSLVETVQDTIESSAALECSTLNEAAHPVSSVRGVKRWPAKTKKAKAWPNGSFRYSS